MSTCARFILVAFLCPLLAPVFAHAGVTHEVRAGDTLAKIASEYVPLAASYTRQEFVDEIKKVNGIDENDLSIGRVITIPVVRSEPVKPATVKRSRSF